MKPVKQSLFGTREKGNNVNFYDKFINRVMEIRTTDERNRVLSDMQEDFTRQVRDKPENRNALSEAYQILKSMCWEAVF